MGRKEIKSDGKRLQSLSADLYGNQCARQVLRRKRQGLGLASRRHGIRRSGRHGPDDGGGVANRLLEQGDGVIGVLVSGDGVVFREKRHHGAGVAFRIGVDDGGGLRADGGARGVQVGHGSVGVGQSWMVTSQDQDVESCFG